MSDKNKNFGQFLSNLLQKNDGAMSTSAVEGLKKKLEEEKTQRIEMRLRQVADRIESQVTELRRIRKQEKLTLECIGKLEERAQRIVEGKDEDD
jgi:hypothetical protein